MVRAKDANGQRWDVALIEPNKVAIYVRWSTDDQGKGTTCEVQLEKCKYFLLSQGWNPNDNLIFIDDGYSGATLNRPEMNRLREYIREGAVQCVVFMKLDRLSRSVVDIVNLVKGEWDGVAFVKSATEPFDTTTQMGKTLMYFLAIFAEWERETIKERTWGGKAKNAENGKNPGFKAPYGYISTEIPGSFKPVESEVEVVIRIFHDYVNGMGATGITQLLNSEGIKFRKGKPWNQSTVRHIIANPFYTGRLVYGRLSRNHRRNKNPESEPFWNRNDTVLVDEKSIHIPQIISDEVFAQAQRLRIERDGRKGGINGRSVGSPHLLGGLAKCRCGHSLVGRAKSAKDTFTYYKCNGASTKGSSFCEAGYVQKEQIDAAVIEDIRRVFSDAERDALKELYTQHHREGIKTLQAAIMNLETSLKELDQQMADVRMDYRKKEIAASDFNSMKSDIEKEKSEIEINLQTQKEELEKLTAELGQFSELDSTAEKVKSWDTLPIEHQKTILRRWIGSLIVYKPKGQDKAHVEITYKWDKPVQEAITKTA